jgi:hypothetical protein
MTAGTNHAHNILGVWLLVAFRMRMENHAIVGWVTLPNAGRSRATHERLIDAWTLPLT